MALMTGKEYEESLKKMKMRIFLFGKELETAVGNPILQPSINSIKATYDLAQMPEYEDLMTATSNLTGEKVNRFTHIHQSAEDLVKKVKMQRLLGQKTAACFQRCVGMDAFNAVYSTTYEVDQKCGTHYHENFRKFAAYVQENDLVVDGAMTDTKGDRSLAPSNRRTRIYSFMLLSVVRTVSLSAVQKLIRQVLSIPTKFLLCQQSPWDRMIKTMQFPLQYL